VPWGPGRNIQDISYRPSFPPRLTPHWFQLHPFPPPLLPFRIDTGVGVSARASFSNWTRSIGSLLPEVARLWISSVGLFHTLLRSPTLRLVTTCSVFSRGAPFQLRDQRKPFPRGSARRSYFLYKRRSHRLSAPPDFFFFRVRIARGSSPPF